MTIARTNLDLLGSGTLLPADLDGLTIFPGVYTVPAGTSNLTGSVTLDGQGNANAGWVFQLPSTLITSPGSVVNVINTGSGTGMFHSSATIDIASIFEGNILALASITLNQNATIGCGRALADTGAVTMEMNTIGDACLAETGGEGSNGFGGGLEVSNSTTPGIPAFSPFVPVDGATVPEPATALLVALGIAGLGFARRRNARNSGDRSVTQVR